MKSFEEKWTEKTGFTMDDLSPGYRRFMEGRREMEYLTEEMIVSPVPEMTDKGYLDFWKAQFRMWQNEPEFARFCKEKIQASRGRQ